MNRTYHNTEQRTNKVPNYAQAAKTQHQQQTRGHTPQQQQQTDPDKPHYIKNNSTYNKSGSTSQHSYQAHRNSYNNYKPKDNSSYGYNNNNRKPPMQHLTMASGADIAPIQFGTVSAPAVSTVTGETPIVTASTSSEAQYGNLPAVTDNTTSNYRPSMRQHQQSQQQQNSLQKDIPRSPRNTNDGRLFTQPYAPRRDPNQGDYNYYNNNNNNSYRNNGYVRPSQSPNQPYHHHHQVQYSPQQINHSPQQQQHNLPPSPMSHRASPNMNGYNSTKKNNQSPHMPQSSPQNIQMTATWSTTGQYYYTPQYPVPGYIQPVTRSPPVIPPPTRKVISIVDPNTGTKLDTREISVTTTHLPPQKEEKSFEFVKPSHVSKAVPIIDPAIRDREQREKKEREEAEKEAQRKAEEDRKLAEEKERLEKEEQERLEKERLEKERLEKEEAERKEAERIRLEEEAAALLEKQRQEEEIRRKEEEERESKRVISELEAERKRERPPQVSTSNLELSSSPVTSPVREYSNIEDISTIKYPSGMITPTPQSDKRFVYSTEFLLQFKSICTSTTDELSALFKELGVSENLTRPPAFRQQSSDRGRGPRTPGAENMFRMGSRDGRMEMGKFNVGRPLTPRSNSGMMERQGSHGGRGGAMMGRGSSRGGMTSGGMKIIRNPPQQNSGPGAPTIPFEQVAPLDRSENRWVPAAKADAAPAEGELMSQEYITRKVNALLNKLTLEKFDSISAQIFDYARQSEKEDDGRSLRTVMKLTFEKACDEPNFVTMWARLCRSMYDAMTDKIRDVGILNEKGEPVSGVLLFRKYLFNRCQSEFEKGWKANMPGGEEAENLMSEEYYAAAKAKRQGLGLIQFIGELFKADMLSERIMYNCVVRLCNDPLNAGDEEAESLCKLLTTIGKVLDRKPKTSKWLDVIIGRMKTEMVNSPKLSSRVKFMIQDLVDLRKDKWVPRNVSNQVGPTTIAKIHEMAEKAKEEKDAANMKRTNSARGPYIPNNNNNNNQYNNGMARTGSYRGNKDNNNFYQNNNNNGNNNNPTNNTGDGWSTVSPGVNTKNTRVADLSNFGKIDRSRSRSSMLSPSYGSFASLSRGKSGTVTDNKSPTEGRSSPATNMFSALSNGGENKDNSKVEEAKAAPEKPKLSDEVVKRKSKNILEEYFSINDKTELVECVKELDEPDYLVTFIGEMLTVVEKKAQDVERMSETIKFLNSENLLEKGLYIRAFKGFMEGYDDLTIDVPQAPKYVAQLLLSASVSPEDVGGDEFDSLQKAYKTLVESQ